jgi:rhodanese-related sulfurtransferase
MKRLDFADFARVREEQDFRVIDVREPHETAEVRLRGVELLPLSEIQRGKFPEDDGRPIAIICRSGGRSAVAANLFEANGLPECTNIEGGTLAAIAAGDEYVERG